MNLKYLSYRKIKNLSLLWASYYLSYWLKSDFRWGKYIALSIEPTNSCNLSCIECPTGTNGLSRKQGSISKDIFKSILEDKFKDLIYLNFYFQGEPFLNKQTVDLIRMASDKRIYTSTSTNAQLITKNLARQIVQSGLNRIIISIDGTTQEVYEKYRVGGSLGKVIQATKFLVQEKANQKSKLRIIFQFLVFKHNEHQISDIEKLAIDLKVDKLEIKSAQIYNYKESTNIPLLNKYARYKKNSLGDYEIKSSLSNKCWRMWHSIVITQDAKVVPCCFDKDVDFEIGDLKINSISEIEKDLKYKTFRKKISKGRPNILICSNCTEGLL